MRRRRATGAIVGLALAVAGLVGFVSPAAAIETESFGLAPAGSSTRTALHEDVRPGGSADDAVRLWNKTTAPITVRLDVQGASLSPDGQVTLGGNEGAARWVSVVRQRVTVPAGSSVDVPVVVTAPRTMPPGVSTAAIVAQLDSSSSGGNVAVVQRVALMVYAKPPEGSSLRAALGWLAWLAVALLMAAMVLVVVAAAAWRRRGARLSAFSSR